MAESPAVYRAIKKESPTAILRLKILDILSHTQDVLSHDNIVQHLKREGIAVLPYSALTIENEMRKDGLIIEDGTWQGAYTLTQAGKEYLRQNEPLLAYRAEDVPGGIMGVAIEILRFASDPANTHPTLYDVTAYLHANGIVLSKKEVEQWLDQMKADQLIAKVRHSYGRYGYTPTQAGLALLQENTIFLEPAKTVPARIQTHSMEL